MTILPPLGRVIPKIVRATSVRPLPTKSPDPENLTRADLERNVRVFAITAQALDLQDGLARLVVALRILGDKRAPGHEIDRILPRQNIRRLHREKLSVAQDGHSVGDSEDLVHSVTDEHDADAAGLQSRDDGEELLHLAVRQRRRRLVHDQDVGVRRQRAGDLDKLLLGNAEGAQRLCRRHVEPDRPEDLFRAGCHRGRVDRPQ